LSLDGKEIAWITSDDVISHLGRPIFGAWFDCDDGSVRSGIVSFAAKKLLGGIEYNAAVPVAELPVHAKLTCLAQRFPIDFILTPNPYQSAEMAQLENHTRVCLKIDLDPTRIVTVASSEPLLSEAAYWVMQNHAFDAPGALVSVLRGVTADKGSRGELVVMLALTLARDRAVGPAGDDGRPVQRWTTLPAFFRHLFHSPAHTNPSELHDDVFAALGQTLSPAGPIATEVTFEDQFQDARVYFNHFIKVHEHSFINRAYFAALSYRGTAVLCEDSKSGIDGIVPFCSKNDVRYGSTPQVELFDTMDPWTLGIFNDMDPGSDSELGEREESASKPVHAPVPLIRIIFALAARTPSLKVVKASRVANSRGLGFCTYDIWCAGISPDILCPIDGNAQVSWADLLGASTAFEVYRQDTFCTQGQVEIRQSMNPGVGDDHGFWSFLPPDYRDRAMLIESDEDEDEEDEGAGDKQKDKDKDKDKDKEV
ncbi:hypothetical protein BJ138DRAFT_1104220, partial [Hygrophoropsis aurantiaca]